MAAREFDLGEQGRGGLLQVAKDAAASSIAAVTLSLRPSNSLQDSPALSQWLMPPDSERVDERDDRRDFDGAAETTRGRRRWGWPPWARASSPQGNRSEQGELEGNGVLEDRQSEEEGRPMGRGADEAGGDVGTLWDELFHGCCSRLTMRERLICWAICFFGGFFITLLSFGAWRGLLDGRPARFALAYSSGNILSLLSISFLVGLRRQLRMMGAEGRWVASAVYVGSVVLTVVAALLLHSAILIFVFVTAQWLALLYYSLSYVPFARRVAGGLLGYLTRSIAALD